MHFVGLVAGLAVLTATSGAVGAADVVANSRIATVEVYPSGATVSRTAESDVVPGDSVIVVPHLPIHIDPESVRVEATSTAGLEIVSVDVRRVEPKPYDRPTEIDKKIKALRAEQAAVNDQISTAGEQARFIRNIVEEAPKQIFDRKGDQPAPDWSQMIVKFGATLAELSATMRTANARLAEIETEIARLEDEQARNWPQAKPTMEARISIAAKNAGKAMFTVRYRAFDASWRPVYDARLDLEGERPSLKIVRRAVIRQSSGEDWADAELTLSTAKPGGRANAPKLPSLVLRLAEPPRAAARKRQRAVPSSGERTMAMEPAMDVAVAAAPAPVPAAERQATMETRGFDLIYSIPGRTSVSGDGRDKKVKIGTDDLTPELVVRAVPVLDTTAYLTVRFNNETAGPILPGNVQLFRDGVFVGKSRVDFVAPKEEVSFGFGKDPAVVVERITLARSKGETGILSTDKTDERRYQITVTNRHERAMKIEIEDRLPKSENEKIVVKPLSTMSKPTTTDPDGRRGVIQWSYDYKPNEKRRILLGFTVSWPEGEQVVWDGLPRR